MSGKAICKRETLYSAIRSVSAVSWLFARSPGRDFTRNVKLPFAKLITLVLSLKGSKQEQHTTYKALLQDMIAYRTAKQNVDKILGLVPEGQEQNREQILRP